MSTVTCPRCLSQLPVRSSGRGFCQHDNLWVTYAPAQKKPRPPDLSRKDIWIAMFLLAFAAVCGISLVAFVWCYFFERC